MNRTARRSEDNRRRGARNSDGLLDIVGSRDDKVVNHCASNELRGWGNRSQHDLAVAKVERFPPGLESRAEESTVNMKRSAQAELILTLE